MTKQKEAPLLIDALEELLNSVFTKRSANFAEGGTAKTDDAAFARQIDTIIDVSNNSSAVPSDVQSGKAAPLLLKRIGRVLLRVSNECEVSLKSCLALLRAITVTLHSSDGKQNARAIEKEKLMPESVIPLFQNVEDTINKAQSRDAKAMPVSSSDFAQLIESTFAVAAAYMASVALPSDIIAALVNTAMKIVTNPAHTPRNRHIAAMAVEKLVPRLTSTNKANAAKAARPFLERLAVAFFQIGSLRTQRTILELALNLLKIGTEGTRESDAKKFCSSLPGRSRWEQFSRLLGPSGATAQAMRNLIDECNKEPEASVNSFRPLEISLTSPEGPPVKLGTNWIDLGRNSIEIEASSATQAVAGRADATASPFIVDLLYAQVDNISRSDNGFTVHCSQAITPLLPTPTLSCANLDTLQIKFANATDVSPALDKLTAAVQNSETASPASVHSAPIEATLPVDIDSPPAREPPKKVPASPSPSPEPPRSEPKAQLQPQSQLQPGPDSLSALKPMPVDLSEAKPHKRKQMSDDGATDPPSNPAPVRALPSLHAKAPPTAPPPKYTPPKAKEKEKEKEKEAENQPPPKRVKKAPVSRAAKAAEERDDSPERIAPLAPLASAIPSVAPVSDSHDGGGGGEMESDDAEAPEEPPAPQPPKKQKGGRKIKPVDPPAPIRPSFDADLPNSQSRNDEEDLRSMMSRFSSKRQHQQYDAITKAMFAKTERKFLDVLAEAKADRERQRRRTAQEVAKFKEDLNQFGANCTAVSKGIHQQLDTLSKNNAALLRRAERVLGAETESNEKLETLMRDAIASSSKNMIELRDSILKRSGDDQRARLMAMLQQGL